VAKNGRVLEPQGGADYTTLRNLTISCKHARALLQVEIEGKLHLLPPPADDGQTGDEVWINCSYFDFVILKLNFLPVFAT